MIEDGTLFGKDERSSLRSVRILRWTSDPTRTFAAPYRAAQTPYRMCSLLSRGRMNKIAKGRAEPIEDRTRPVIPHPPVSEDGKGRKRRYIYPPVTHKPVVTEPRHAPIPRVQGISVLAVNVHRVRACLPAVPEGRMLADNLLCPVRVDPTQRVR
jgi:hypothetical protein